MLCPDASAPAMVKNESSIKDFPSLHQSQGCHFTFSGPSLPRSVQSVSKTLLYSKCLDAQIAGDLKSNTLANWNRSVSNHCDFNCASYRHAQQFGCFRDDSGSDFAGALPLQTARSQIAAIVILRFGHLRERISFFGVHLWKPFFGT